MDFFTYVLIIMMIIGSCLVIYGAFFGAKKQNADAEAETQSSADKELASLVQKLSSLESSVTEADEAANILEDMSKNIFKEFENKYQEMLFLYNLIDEKQKTLAKPDATPAMPSAPGDMPAAAMLAMDGKKAGINPKYANVLELNAAGISADEIAKQLNMGKGQVALILNLGGGADG